MKLVIRKHKGAKKIKNKKINQTSRISKKEQHILFVDFVQCVYLCVFINTIQQIIIIIIIQHKRKRKEIHKTLYYFSLPEWTKYNKLKLKVNKTSIRSPLKFIYRVMYVMYRICLLSASLVHARVVTEGGWINQLKGHKRTFTSIPKLSSHHAVNTENKGVKDKLCFGEGWGRCPLTQQQRILHCLDAVPPFAYVLLGISATRRCTDTAVRVVLPEESKGRKERTEVFCHLRGGAALKKRWGSVWITSTPFLTTGMRSEEIVCVGRMQHDIWGFFCLFFRASPSSSYLQSPA